jgi:hypothetical protein
LLLGDSEGLLDGDKLGEELGSIVGNAVGLNVGYIVGEPVGDAVGLKAGAELGLELGLELGEEVDRELFVVGTELSRIPPVGLFVRVGVPLGVPTTSSSGSDTHVHFISKVYLMIPYPWAL